LWFLFLFLFDCGDIGVLCAVQLLSNTVCTYINQAPPLSKEQIRLKEYFSSILFGKEEERGPLPVYLAVS
jgi:hypothetical protein